jgi:hypothetical protein
MPPAGTRRGRPTLRRSSLSRAADRAREPRPLLGRSCEMKRPAERHVLRACRLPPGPALEGRRPALVSHRVRDIPVSRHPNDGVRRFGRLATARPRIARQSDILEWRDDEVLEGRLSTAKTCRYWSWVGLQATSCGRRRMRRGTTLRSPPRAARQPLPQCQAGPRRAVPI